MAARVDRVDFAPCRIRSDRGAVCGVLFHPRHTQLAHLRVRPHAHPPKVGTVARKPFPLWTSGEGIGHRVVFYESKIMRLE